MKKIISNSATTLILLTFGGVALSGCATVTQGTKEVLEVQSEPSGASVVTSHGYSCSSTPCVIEVPRKDSFTVTLSKSGCEEKTVSVLTRMSKQGGAAVAGNVLVGGLIGLGIDSATGAAKELVPNPLLVELDC